MSGSSLRTIVTVSLVTGAVLGFAGSVVPSASLRGLLWGIDGTALVIATALLTLHYLRLGNDLVAGGFLVFAIGEGVILSGTAMNPITGSIPSFGAGASLWAAALVLISAPRVFPMIVRVLGLIAALLFFVTSMQIFSGAALTSLSKPLPFVAYPFLVLTLLGWAWVHWKGDIAIKTTATA